MQKIHSLRIKGHHIYFNMTLPLGSVLCPFTQGTCIVSPLSCLPVLHGLDSEPSVLSLSYEL